MTGLSLLEFCIFYMIAEIFGLVPYNLELSLNFFILRLSGKLKQVYLH